jgi:MFS family permease
VTDPSAPDSRLSGDPLAPLPYDARPGADQQRPGWRRRLAQTRVDTRPLRRSRDFRLLFLGGTVSLFGSMVTYVAVPFHVYDLTGSTAAVGLLGVAELLPIIAFGLWGGALADAVDRRRMVLATEVGLTVASLLLLVNALLPEPQVWPLFLFAALVASLDGLQRPSLDALIPRIVAHDQLAAASALSSLQRNLGQIAGPAVGGVLIVTAGVEWAYAIDVVSFAASIAAVALMRRSPPPAGASRPSVRGIVVGLRYAVSRPELLGTYAVDTAAMLFAMPMALYPAMAKDVLNEPWSLGLLYTAGSVGSLAATLTSGWTSHVHHHGRAVAYAAAVWGAAIAGFGFAGNVWVAFAFLAVAGAADMVSGVFRSTIWNQTIPDELRGRLAGIELLSYSIGPVTGNARAGLVAGVWNVRGSVVSGGILCVASVAALAAALRSFMHYDDRTNEHAVRERRRRADTSSSKSE